MNPFTVLYTMPTCACLLSLSLTYWRLELRICYRGVVNPPNIHRLIKNHRRSYSYLLLLVLFVTAIITSIIDIYYHYNNFSIFNWICFYWPGIAVSNSMIHVANIINAASYNYKLLNLYLEPYTHRNLTLHQRFKMSEKSEVPIKLMQRFPESQDVILHKIFVIYDEISRIVRLVNKIVGKRNKKKVVKLVSSN